MSFFPINFLSLSLTLNDTLKIGQFITNHYYLHFFLPFILFPFDPLRTRTPIAQDSTPIHCRRTIRGSTASPSRLASPLGVQISVFRCVCLPVCLFYLLFCLCVLFFLSPLSLSFSPPSSILSFLLSLLFFSFFPSFSSLSPSSGLILKEEIGH